MELFITVESYNRGDFESEIKSLLEKGWKLINANSLAIPEPSTATVFIYFTGFLIKEASKIANQK